MDIGGSPSKMEDPFLKEEIMKTFIDQIYLEKEIEKFKSELSKAPDFSCMECFKLFDQTSRGYLTLSDLKDTLRQLLGHEFTGAQSEETYLLFKHYDKDQDGKLNYQEFCNLFLPKDKYLAKVI